MHVTEVARKTVETGQLFTGIKFKCLWDNNHHSFTSLFLHKSHTLFYYHASLHYHRAFFYTALLRREDILFNSWIYLFIFSAISFGMCIFFLKKVFTLTSLHLFFFFSQLMIRIFVQMSFSCYSRMVAAAASSSFFFCLYISPRGYEVRFNASIHGIQHPYLTADLFSVHVQHPRRCFNALDR